MTSHEDTTESIGHEDTAQRTDHSSRYYPEIVHVAGCVSEQCYDYFLHNGPAFCLSQIVSRNVCWDLRIGVEGAWGSISMSLMSHFSQAVLSGWGHASYLQASGQTYIIGRPVPL
jgi:hypothetical protein